MEPSVRVTAAVRSDKKARKSIAPAAIKTLLLICGCAGSAFTFLDCMELRRLYTLAAVTAAAACLFFTAVFSAPGKTPCIGGGAAAAVYAAAAALFRERICAGAANIACIFLAKVRWEYRDKPFIELTEPERADADTAVCAVFAVTLMCGLAAWAAVRACSASGVAAATCAPAFSVLMFGLEPSYAAFFPVVICWAGMFALEAGVSEGLSGERYGKYSAWCGFWTALLSAVCIAAIVLLTRAAGYERPRRLNEVYDSAVEYLRGGGVQRTIEEIVTRAVGERTVSGPINHGRLGENDEISFDGRTVLEVTIPKSDSTIYLRGFVGSVYTGNSWQELSGEKLRELEEMTGSFENPGLDPLLLDGYNLRYSGARLPEYSFSVKNVSAGDECLYMPYCLVPESVARYGISGSSFKGGEGSCIGRVYDPSGYYGYRNLLRTRWSVPAALSADEAAYRQFVYASFMDIPEGFPADEIFDQDYLDYITFEAEKTGKSALDEMTVLSRKLYYIRKWLRDNCEYSLSTEKLGGGEDFVNKFLERKEGSCSHFASAAVMMCRYAGIPARYVEGYIIKPGDFPAGTAVGSAAEVEVTDARGHAWAEVYLDGYGWYPMEFTSGYGNVRTALPTETAAAETEPAATGAAEGTTVPGEITETSVPGTEGTEYVQTEPASESSAPAFPAVTAVPPQTEEITEVSLTEQPERDIGFTVFGIESGTPAKTRYDLTWVVVLLLAIGLVPLALVLRRNFFIARRMRMSCKDGAMADYRRFGKLLRIMGMPEQGDMGYAEYGAALAEKSEYLSDSAGTVISLALKASFGGDALTRDDAEELRFTVNSLAKRYCAGLSRAGRLRAKYLHLIL